MHGPMRTFSKGQRPARGRLDVKVVRSHVIMIASLLVHLRGTHPKASEKGDPVGRWDSS